MRKGTGRRGNCEGSIHQRKDGRWCAEYIIGINPNTGKYRKKYCYGKSQKEVQAKLKKLISDEQTGKISFSNDITVGQWIDTWLKDFGFNLRPRTYDSYDSTVRLHINPIIGKIKLENLKPIDLQKLYNQKSKSGRIDNKGGLAPSSVERMHTIIHKALEQAVLESLILINPANAAKAPRRYKKEMRVLSLKEQAQFEEILKGDRLGTAFLLMLYTGVRRGELLALRWRDIFLKEKYLTVNRALLRIKKDGKSVLEFSYPKTKAGTRPIPIPALVIEELKRYKVSQNKEKLKAGSIYSKEDLVFCTELGTPIEPRNLNRKFYSLRKKANLEDVSLHGLRHTFATRLLELEVHPKVVQELLGHRQITTTMDTYSHVLPNIKQAAAQKLNTLLKKKKPSAATEGK